jgi:isoleucyl-tRNA synthetase
MAYKDMQEMDKWILSILNGIIEKTTGAYDEYEFHVPTFVIHQFCVNELSSFYLDASKDRLYADSKDSNTRRSCQTALWIILHTLTRLMAPVLSFTTEETWQEMRKIDASLSESIFLSDWPEVDDTMVNPDLEKKWSAIGAIKGSISKALEKARTEGIIGHPLEAQVILEPGQALETINLYSPEEWETFNIVSDFKTGTEKEVKECSITYTDDDLSLLIGINKAPGEKCPRCWKYSQNTDDDGLCPRCSGVMKS